MKIDSLRKLAGKEEIDYQFLIDALKEYANPRDKITTWLKSGALIRIKKGLYIFGDTVALQPYSKEVLANLIYGPSAISLLYALSYYGLIPERVTTITSITNNRTKMFVTPVGEYKYYYLPSKKYAVGITLNLQINQHSFLIASPEKALCDQIYITDKDHTLHNLDDMEKYLVHDLRIDEALLRKLQLQNLEEICNIYRNSNLFLLYNYIKKRQ